MPSLFQTALLLETAANISSLIPMILTPSHTLTYIVKQDTNQITPLAQTLTQWLGGIVVLATAPLLLSYSEQGDAKEVRARRRLTYSIMGISEVVLGGVMLAQYSSGKSGLMDRVLVLGTGAMGICWSYDDGSFRAYADYNFRSCERESVLSLHPSRFDGSRRRSEKGSVASYNAVLFQ